MDEANQIPPDTGLGTETLDTMARLGIIVTRANTFHYGGYRYTLLQDALAEARRHPR
jgi:hypothetical protein